MCGLGARSKNKELFRALLKPPRDAVGSVRRLLSRGADVDARNPEGKTALHVAITRGQADIVTELIAAGANVSAKTRDGLDALHLALKQGHAHLVEMLWPYAQKQDSTLSRKFFRRLSFAKIDVSELDEPKSIWEEACSAGRLAVAAYDAQMLIEGQHFERDLIVDRIRLQNEDSKTPQLVVLKSWSCTAVAFRGTASLNDVITDMAFGRPEDSCSHAGVMKALIPVQQELNSIFAETKKRLILCGHSLGGAFAISSLLLFLKTNPLQRPKKVHIHTFGAPLVLGSSDKAILESQKDWCSIFNFIHAHDFVPRALTRPGITFLNDFLTFTNLDLLQELHLINRRRGVTQSEAARAFSEALACIRARNIQFCAVGDYFVMSEESFSKLTYLPADAQDFDDELCPSLMYFSYWVPHHSMVFYIKLCSHFATRISQLGSKSEDPVPNSL